MKNYIEAIYCYDELKPLTYEKLKTLGEGAMVWCEYSSDWVCKVQNEIKTVVADMERSCDVDLRGSCRCIGDLRATMNRDRATIRVYELIKI